MFIWFLGNISEKNSDSSSNEQVKLYVRTFAFKVVGCCLFATLYNKVIS